MELHALFKGRVQGVGFRWTVVDCAEKFQLTGTVKNLSNGSVEVYAYGDKERLTSFLEALQTNSGPAHIDSVVTTYQQVEVSLSCFKILK
ncbi:MAG: Acylphosphatase [Chlamydiales bacterium]|nr:Acylphosphatase [Chlamydiales bacterium]